MIFYGDSGQHETLGIESVHQSKVLARCTHAPYRRTCNFCTIIRKRKKRKEGKQL